MDDPRRMAMSLAGSLREGTASPEVDDDSADTEPYELPPDEPTAG